MLSMEYIKENEKTYQVQIEELTNRVEYEQRRNQRKDKEIERLNNILKALEKGIKDNIAELENLTFSYDRIDEDKEILRFLQELKGSDKE